MSRQRADLVLVGRGFFASRAKAREAIAAGLVRIDGKPLTKASALVGPSMRIEAAAPYPWVSRGGVKLAAGLDAFGFDPRGRICLDVGASTGGFCDVLLSRGAAHIYAVDVGHGQLHAQIAGDPRITGKEGVDARDLKENDFSAPPSLITCDVSFISLRLVLPAVLTLAAPSAMLVVLVKPQFEVGPSFLAKGIVKDEEARRRACADIAALIRELGWSVVGEIASPIDGGDGNREFLVGATRTGAADPTSACDEA